MNSSHYYNPVTIIELLRNFNFGINIKFKQSKNLKTIERVKKMIKEEVYPLLVNNFNNMTTQEEILELQIKFKKLDKYKDSEYFVELCNEKLNTLKNETLYAEADREYKAGNYESAVDIFRSIALFGDSIEKAQKCHEKNLAKYGCKKGFSKEYKYADILKGIYILKKSKSKQCIILPSEIYEHEIGCDGFVACSAISITLPQNIKVIRCHAFNKCKNLRAIIIPNAVTSIEDSAFAGCSSLIVAVIPSSVKKIKDNVFENCGKLKYIIFDGSSSNWKEVCGNLILNKNTMIYTNDEVLKP